ncbi:hypothetical protein HMPREF1348_01733 [Enterococcus faecium 505]|uniref:Uncharacterized protein n=1 Tax=Enterococcus faecium 505 TaxID=1134806 RepID=J6YWE9_ENTFC|nr:hypothetical protein HMPREF1348_01733 [Enterococcus faecium 505]
MYLSFFPSRSLLCVQKTAVLAVFGLLLFIGSIEKMLKGAENR